MSLQAPRGTNDVLPAQSVVRDELLAKVAAPAFARAGYGRIETPIFEDTALFSRGVGASTDIVVPDNSISHFGESVERLSCSSKGRHSSGMKVCRIPRSHGIVAASG